MSLSKLQQAEQYLKMDDLVNAERLFTQTLTNQPDCGQAFLGMGIIALKTQQFDKAVSFLTKSCELMPLEAIPLLRLAEAFNGVNSEIDALTVLKYAADHIPNHALVHYHLGLQQTIMGALYKAIQSHKVVIQQSQEAVVSFSLFELTRLDSHSEQYLTPIEKRLSQTNTDVQEQTVLHYALGNVLHNMQVYSKAWRQFEKGNLLQAQMCSFKTIELQPFFEQIKDTVNTQVLSSTRQGDGDLSAMEITPIFIVGLPRTGSTLLEQLLTEHQDISSAGEVPYLSRDVEAYLYSQSQLHYPHSMTHVTNEQLDTAAKLYLEKMRIHAKGKRYVIDKLPANFQSIGLIYKLFPNAKVIHIQRDLPDVALSIYRNSFSENEPYFCSLSDLKQYCDWYRSLMAHWHTHLPGFIHEVRYEQLITDKVATLTSIFEFCELSPIVNDKRDYSDRKVIKTLSNVQARRTMSTTLTKNWHNYAEHLGLFVNQSLASQRKPNLIHSSPSNHN